METGYRKIFWGMFFSTFHINLGPIEILPNFIGLLIICSGIKEILKDYKYESFEQALKYISIHVVISFIAFVSPFVSPFIGLATLFENNIGLSIIWFNIGNILEMFGIAKLLEGSSEILSERLVCNDESMEYRSKIDKYILIYSMIIVLSNINFIFMGSMTTVIIAIVALITKIWVMFSLKKLSEY